MPRPAGRHSDAAVKAVGVNVWFFWSAVVAIAAAALCLAQSRRYDRAREEIIARS